MAKGDPNTPNLSSGTKTEVKVTKVSDERVVLLTKPRIKINEIITMKKRKKRVNTETSFLKALK